MSEKEVFQKEFESGDNSQISKIHNWSDFDKYGNKIFPKHNFGMNVKEIREDKKGRIYLVGMVYYPHKKGEGEEKYVYPPSAMEGHLKRLFESVEKSVGHNIRVYCNGIKDWVKSKDETITYLDIFVKELPNSK